MRRHQKHQGTPNVFNVVRRRQPWQIMTEYLHSGRMHTDLRDTFRPGAHRIIL